ncbi:uncharacterized protein METZ01_LOCUS340280 [marine metagenome]|uniref:DivIVA domain-containing protein n=1 Tax=marine metagenome TaxID=408172 RepID=A0A382QPQ7_9ZZZZ
MRLNYLDILEQCFRNKIFGYDKEDVDTFLHLVAEDFKEMAEELELLNKKLAQKNQGIEKVNARAIRKPGETKAEALKTNPDIIKEKAKRIINAARELANQHKKKAEHELSSLKKEIEKLKEEKKTLTETPKQ